MRTSTWMMAESDAIFPVAIVEKQGDLYARQQELVQKVLEDALRDAEIMMPNEAGEKGKEEKEDSVTSEVEQRNVVVDTDTAPSLPEPVPVSGAGVHERP